ncbi:Dynactin subunit 3 [Acipenser ruthenus]|uniref:Dynactin subunit 3 n=1 Tax=Acipenser ruthenus TaxID=7906 RepID=A0A662YTX8_ACIRT|nr:Dynactin subunit 3 [Acipenser ruthenus]
MDSETGIESLRLRIDDLERKLYGDRGVRGSRLAKCADALVKVQASLGNTANKRERVKILHKKIDDLLKYLDPQFIDKISVPDAMKVEFILAEEEFILSQASLLEQLSGLHPLLDSSHIKGEFDQCKDLTEDVEVLFEDYNKMDQCKDLTDDVEVLFEDYNKMVSFTASS